MRPSINFYYIPEKSGWPAVLSLTTTSRFPPSVLKQAENQILERFSGRNDKYWGVRTRVAPQIRIAPITSNQTAISSLAPDASCATPSLGIGTGGGASSPGAAPAQAGGGEPGVPEGPRSRDFIQFGLRSPWASVPHGREFRGTQLDEPVEPSITLSVPCIDYTSGLLKRAVCRGSTTRTGNRLQVTVELLNDAARTAYGSLSTPGFQSEAARLEVAFQFSGYAPVSSRPQLVLGGKISNAVLLAKPRDDAESIRVASGGRELVVSPALAARLSQNLTLAGRIITSDAALALPTRLEYVRRTLIRQQSMDAFFSCAELGTFYREKQAAVTVSIGCAEVFRLGQASPLTYQEVIALNRPSYRVFRNLRQPGRFLQVPLSFEITRYAPGMPEREYRPALIVYAALDAEPPENNRIRFEAIRGPAVSLYEMEDLRRRLLA